jgi:predicted MFS family arabinose efflux permease
MVYPLLPAFSRGLGVSEDQLAGLLSLRSTLGLASPAYGYLPDRFGRRAAMLAGLILFSASLGLVIAWPTFIAFGVAVIGVSSAKLLFDPALLAYLGDRTPYTRRGLVLATSELGWSGATFIGIPLISLLISGRDWRAPFPVLMSLGLLAALGVWFIIPPQPRPAASTTPPPANARGARWAALLLNPRIVGAMSIGLFSSLANEMLNVVYGRWMEQSFRLDVATLGATAIVIGGAELMGEGAVAVLSDRLGKRRTILLGVGLSTLAYLALPFLTADLALALVGVFLAYFSFEMTIVGALPLISELVPEARGTVLSTTSAFHSVGRMAGALAGGPLFRLGFVWTGLAAAGLNVLLAVIILVFVRERHVTAA